MAGAGPPHPPAPALPAGSYSQSPQSGPLKGQVLRLKRSHLIVANLERSIRFYSDVVGLELYSVDANYNRDPASLAYPVFNIPKGARRRAALFNSSDAVRGLTIEEVLDMPVRFPDRPRPFALLFETDDAWVTAQAAFSLLRPR